MFGYALPGWRDVRGPFVVGSLWAWILWLWIGPSVLKNESIHDVLNRYGLTALPDPVLLSVIALLAYTFGSLLMVQTTPFRWFDGTIQRGKNILDRLQEPDPVTHLSHWSVRLFRRFPFLGRWVANRFDANRVGASIDSHLRALHVKYLAQGRFIVTNNYGPGCFEEELGLRGSFDATEFDRVLDAQEDRWDVSEALTNAFMNQVKKDASAVEVRIQMSFPDVYNEIDRLRAEGQLRVSIFWPGMLAIVSQTLLWNLWWVFAIIPVLALAADGQRRLTKASEKTWSCLIAGEVSSPLLDEIEFANDSDPTPIEKLENILWFPEGQALGEGQEPQ